MSDGFADDALAGLIGSGPEEFPTGKREFKPWHRPRKQYVRDQQWLKELRVLVDGDNLSGQEFRYLSLPGDDMLDVRFLHTELCDAFDMRMRFLGFNLKEPDDPFSSPALNTALFGSTRLERVDRSSQVLNEDIRQAGVRKSVSWLTVRSYEGFHAINLDLCESIATGKQSGLTNYFAALNWILRLQVGRVENSVLFITTRIDPEAVGDEQKAHIAEMLAEAEESCDAYRDNLRAHLDVGDIAARQDLEVEESVILGVVLWVIRTSNTHGLKAKVRSVASYRSGDAARGEGGGYKSSITDDLVSIVIRLESDPCLPEDPTGLTVGAASVGLATFCAQAAIVPQRLADVARVDLVLATDDKLRREYTNSSARLLEDCGYIQEEYFAWVEAIEPVGIEVEDARDD